MELNFDIRGNLKPYKKIELDYIDFKQYFVDSFINSQTRNQIIENYEKFIDDFSKEVTENFVQWIDGSFVSNKENPKDIDFVSLIDFKTYEEKEQLIEAKFRLQGARVNYDLIDAYSIKVYPEGHKRRNITEFDKLYWQNWFSQTKKNRLKKKFPKGYIEIQFGAKK